MNKIIYPRTEFNQRGSPQTSLEKETTTSTPQGPKGSPSRPYNEIHNSSYTTAEVAQHATGNSATSESSSKQSSVKLNIWKQSNVGFSTLPSQINRKANQKGFTFNVLIVGASGLGKSTFLNSLFMTDIYNDTYTGPSVRYFRDKTIGPVASATFELVENNVSLGMTVIDTPGFAESLDNSACWEPILSEIDRRNSAFMDAELTINRNISGCGSHGRLGVFPEQLIHACFYFIEPTGHGLRLVDLTAMRHLCDKVNLIPLIAKADTMTTEECRNFKSVVKEQLQQEGIHTYDFPLSALTAEKARSADERETSLSEVRCRVYPWGVVETDSLEHNDFRALKTLLMCYHMQDLIDVTYTNHYTNYRLNRLTEAMDSAGFSTQDGRDPLTQLEAEKKAHQERLDKLVQEMDNVYVEKVRERENRLRETERDMTERIEIMRQQLEAEAQDLARERQRFNDERLSWELDNRDYADSIMGSFDKLERIKKRRGLF